MKITICLVAQSPKKKNAPGASGAVEVKRKRERKNDEMNKNERGTGAGSKGASERAERLKRRKVNIARDGIRRNYCCIKIYRLSEEVRLGKTYFIPRTHRLWVSDILRTSQRNPQRDRDGSSSWREVFPIAPRFDPRSTCAHDRQTR